MGGMGKMMDPILKNALVNPKLMLAIKHFPNELLELKIGRLLSPFEANALGRGLEQRGFGLKISEAASSLIKNDSLLKGLQGLQDIKKTQNVEELLGGRFPPAMLHLIKDMKVLHGNTVEISENFNAMENTERLA